MKKLQNNFTTIEQSKRLLELGVSADSADCAIFGYDDNYEQYELRVIPFNKQFTTFNLCDIDGSPWKLKMPCWSVGRLMEIYDICFPKNGDWPNTRKWEDYLDVDEYNILIYTIDCIETAVEKGYIDFSKLEE
jgi:hypothetical protein